MTSFRPRPIDIDKPLTIIKDELNDEETRSMPILSTGMEQHEENESHIREAIAEAQRKSTRITANIPTPVVKEVAYYDRDTALWNQPNSYIKHFQQVESLFFDPSNEEIEYDIDSDDENWISTEINKNGIQLLSHSDFELLLNTFEQKQAREVLFSSIKTENIPLISYEKAIKASKELKRVFTIPLLTKVYNYWIEKRKKLKRPLLLSVIPPPEFDNPSPLVAFRPRENETKKKVRKSNIGILEQLKLLREELVKGKTILDTIRKRELSKKKYILASKRIFEVRVIQREKQISQLKLSSSYSNNSRLYSLDSSSGEDSDESMEDYNDNDISKIKKSSRKSKRKIEKKEEIVIEDKSYEPHDTWDRFPPHYHNEENNPSDKEKYWGTINLEGMKPFRGRARMGRGGRMFIDRGSHRIIKTSSKPKRISLY